jgi:hypothetical protein
MTLVIDPKGEVGIALQVNEEAGFSWSSMKLFYFSRLRNLKVGGNEKNGGSGRSQMLDYGLGPWRSWFIFNFNMQFLIIMSYFLFRL